MYYNESNVPQRTKNPLVQRSSNYTSQTFSKRSSGQLNQSFHLNSQNNLCPSRSRNSIDSLAPSAFLKRNNSVVDAHRLLNSKQSTSSKENRIRQLRLEINKADEKHENSWQNQSSIMMKESKTSNWKSNKSKIERFTTDYSQHNMPVEESMFSPKILNKSKSMVRKTNVSTLLYEDALRRQEKELFLLESERRQIDLQMTPKINSNTNALVLKKMYSQFSQLVCDEEINPLIALSVLEQLFNVNLNPHKQSPNYELVQRLITLLTGSSQLDEIKTERLWQFVKLIIIGQSNDNLFSKEEERQVAQNYQYFYKERMARERKTVTPEKCSFRPQTLESSSKMAQSFRQKTCRKIDSFVENQKLNLNVNSENYNIQDMYVLDHHKKLAELERKRIKQEQEELSHCTFKPDLSPSQSTAKVVRQKPKIALKANKVHHLRTQYTYSSQRESQKDSMAASKIIPIRSREEREKIRKARESRASLFADSIKDVEKAVLRMSIGRQKRQFSNEIMQRGYAKDQNWTTHQQEMHRRSMENCKKLKGYHR